MTLSNNSRGLDHEDVFSCLKTVIKCGILENGFNIYTRRNSILIQTKWTLTRHLSFFKKKNLFQNQFKVIIKPKYTRTRKRITIY